MATRRFFFKSTFFFFWSLIWVLVLYPKSVLSFIATRMRRQRRQAATGPLPGLYAWGYNSSGKLGINAVSNRSSPVQVGTLTNWIGISGCLNGNHVHALKVDGTLWGWGSSGLYEIGDGTVVTKSSPVQIGTLQTWIQVAGGDYYNHAIKSDGTLWAWGSDSWVVGVLGNEDIYAVINSPIQVGTLNDWLQISNGLAHSLAIKSNGSLWVWGGGGASGSLGDLGLGDTNPRSSPTQLGTLRDWVQVTASSSNASLALKSNGTLWGWGYNSWGILGDNTTTWKSSPVQIGTLNSWVQVSVGSNHSLALKSDGTLWAWGYNSDGQLGDDSILHKSSPTQVGTLNTWASIASGSSWSLALRTDGTMWSWGFNTQGILGVGNTVHRSSPTQIGTLNGWTSIATAKQTGFAIRG